MAPRDITTLLQDWRAGNQQAAEELLPLVYSELHALAGHFMRRERPWHTLQSTALVHEAYLRLVEKQDVAWQDRAHFLALAARLHGAFESAGLLQAEGEYLPQALKAFMKARARTVLPGVGHPFAQRAFIASTRL